MEELTIDQQKALALAAARMRASQQQQKVRPVTLGPEGFKQSMRETVAEAGPAGKFMAGAGTLVDDAALRLKQLVTGNLSPQEQERAVANRIIRESPLGMTGAMAGGVGAFGPMGVTSLLGNTALGAGIGAVGTPVLPGESGVKNALLGGAGGLAGGVVGKAITGSPFVKPTQETQRLLKEGVVPTIGQNAASSKSSVAQALGRAEEKAASLPIVGDFISGARRRALGEFNRAALQKVSPERVSQIGAEGVDDAIEAAGRAFDDVYRGTKVAPTKELVKRLQDAKDKPLIGLSQEAEKKFDRIIERLITQRLKPGTDAGLVKKTIESDIGKEARKLAFSTNSDDKALGEALFAARDAVRDAMNKAINDPAKSAMLPGLNRAYAAGKEVEKAAERASAHGGVFTPYQLQKAAGPGGVLRPLADDAQAVLASRVPNSGTADRALQAILATGQAPATGTLGYVGGSLLTAPIYSRMASRYLLGDLSGQGIMALAPYIAQGARGILATPR